MSLEIYLKKLKLMLIKTKNDNNHIKLLLNLGYLINFYCYLYFRKLKSEGFLNIEFDRG